MQAILNFTRWKRVSQIPATYLFIIGLVVSVQVVADDESHEHSYEQHAAHEHAMENQHDQHDEYDGHDDAELKFSNAELAEFSLKLAQASSGDINKTLALTGEVIIAPERLYHIVPRVAGVVRKVFKHLGDQVNAGELLATLSSRELADAKAEYVAADSLMQLADANLKREQNLYKSKVTSRRKYLAAKQVHTEISIKRTAAGQHLQAIGLTEKTTRAILRSTTNDLTLYVLKAPSEGVIIAKHAAQVVQVGRRDHAQVEILQGLAIGQTYVGENAFVLKAQSQKASFGHGHNH